MAYVLEFFRELVKDKRASRRDKDGTVATPLCRQAIKPQQQQPV